MDTGFDPRQECTLMRFDLDVGKHGDTGRVSSKFCEHSATETQMPAHSASPFGRGKSQKATLIRANFASSGHRQVTATVTSPRSTNCRISSDAVGPNHSWK